MKLISVGLLLFVALFAHSAPIAHDEIVSKTAEGFRLLRLEDGAEPEWVTEDQKLELMKTGKHFFDVTEVWETKQSLPYAKAPAVTYPTPSHQSQVRPLISTLSVSNMQTNLNKLSSFNNRYYRASTGKDASQYILDTVSTIASGRSGVTVQPFTHSWTQFSIIAKIPGSKAQTPVTIIGAHMDSINLQNPTSGRAPGYDDDGTGTVNLIEIFRALMVGDFKPSTPVEFHWYSGEEAGLLGSQAIATQYKRNGVSVKAFMELDMSGYFKPGTEEVMALQADYIDSGLNTWLGKLIDEYSNIGWTMDIPCGYACSDHASWNEEGYPTSFPYEAVTGDDNPEVHSPDDNASVRGFSWSHSLEFAKVGLAFVYEMAI
ncbi:Zn-dependent exopeptidase [Dendrothele bispora CBS 962.96]|uniref:Peptide hydrolase n=1 Tax=Dendrothele bispora (strain CBS 962.96) TaxID=1314807 RepID=A0A4S8M1L5_DENBC|nr:Zn-dependent exopeptidase [Dendrothele bispora CBS 962.96]